MATRSLSIFSFLPGVRAQTADALFGKFAIGGTAEIHFWIDKPVVAVRTFPGGVILEEFHGMTTLGTGFPKIAPGFQ